MDKQNEQYALKAANLIIQAFDDYRFGFQQTALDGKKRFEEARWKEAQVASAYRINLYELGIIGLIDKLKTSMPAELIYTSEFWVQIKQKYESIIYSRLDDELAETWFNSIFCDVVGKNYINNESMFMLDHKRRLKTNTGISISRFYDIYPNLNASIRKILTDYKFSIAYEDLDRDVKFITTYMHEELPSEVFDKYSYIEMLSSVFYRNKAAYLIGRIVVNEKFIPFVIPLLHNEGGGIYADTILTKVNQVSILFSFTHSYFMVDVPIPREFIDFLMQILPNKRQAEIYASIGFYKHGKTLFVRDLLNHLEQSNDKFELADGVEGMVMSVLNLPKFNMVFKIIKNRFSPAKEINSRQVRDKYRLVKRHDRAGRMADTQEFSNFKFKKSQFSQKAIEQLLDKASENIEISGDTLLIKHMWVQRYMQPLNLYIEKANAEELEQILYDYGNALKQLAVSNIFPGDMLLKNFGVTRYGRVVFYDYDEINYLTDINFRNIPPPRFPEDEMASEPWYSVGANDVFPEEFPVFLFADIRLRKLFNKMHGELFTAKYWQNIQAHIKNGEVMDLFPYPHRQRFSEKYMKK